MENLTPQLTEAEVLAFETKASEIAKQRGYVQVHPVVFIMPESLERIVAYLRNPTFTEKLYAMDQAITVGPFMSASNMSELVLIKDESHPLASSDAPQADMIRLGIVNYCMGLISHYQNQFKKK